MRRCARQTRRDPHEGSASERRHLQTLRQQGLHHLRGARLHRQHCPLVLAHTSDAPPGTMCWAASRLKPPVNTSSRRNTGCSSAGTQVDPQDPWPGLSAFAQASRRFINCRNRTVQLFVEVRRVARGTRYSASIGSCVRIVMSRDWRQARQRRLFVANRHWLCHKRDWMTLV